MIELLSDLPPKTIGVRASGDVTSEDYEKVLIPAIEVAIKEHGAVRLLYVLEASITDFTLGAMWDDAKVGFGHMQDFEKVAVVSDNTFIRGTIHALHFIMHKWVEVFSLAEEAEARRWLAGDDESR